jgi:hypothetical protein
MFRLTLALPLAICLLAALAAGQASTGAQQKPRGEASLARTANDKEVRPHLVRVETITSPTEMATNFLPPLKCDSEGNLYFQTDPLARAIHKLSSKGEPIALFRASSSTDLKVDFGAFFSLDQGGELYQVVFPHEITRYLFTYHSDGTVKSEVKLSPGFPWMPHALAVFPSGQMLITGSEYDQDRTAEMWPFTGIFSADGSLLKEIKLEDDGTLRDMAVSGDARVSRPGSRHTNKAVDFSEIDTATDGNAYLMRWTNPAIFYAISAGGEVVRRFTVDPGASSSAPTAMHVFKNRIAILFIDDQTHDKIMKVVDLEGHEIATYDELRVEGKAAQGMLGGAFACYTENPTRFTFLGASDDNRLQFWIAEPR